MNAAPSIPSPAPKLDALPRLLKIKEVAAWLAVSAEQVSQLRDGGELDFVDIRAQGAATPSWRITRESLAAFEQRRQTKTP